MQIFPINEKIENINDQYWTLRAEEVLIQYFTIFVLFSHMESNAYMVELVLIFSLLILDRSQKKRGI